MIDRYSDPVILSALSDRHLADRALEATREFRSGTGISERDGSVGATLHYVIPALAKSLGAETTGYEDDVIAKKGPQPLRLSELRDMSSEILVASMYASTVAPGSPFLQDPISGNIGAVLLDRVMRNEGIPQSRRPDGSFEPTPAGPDMYSGNPGIIGEKAIGTHAVAKHLLAKTEAIGHDAVPFWSPAHLEEKSERTAFKNLLSPTSTLNLDAERVYAKRLAMLSDRYLAEEMVEMAREIRDRRGIEDQIGGYHRYALHHMIPEMGAKFGVPLLPGEGDRDKGRERSPQANFEGMSSAVMEAIGEGGSYIVRNGTKDPSWSPPTLGERLLFNEASNGNPMVMLLDRVAVLEGHERGGPYDRTGRHIAEISSRRDVGKSHAWSPEMLREAKPVPAPVRNAAQMMADARAQSFGV